jgi:DNA-binding response OmpR family regulator
LPMSGEQILVIDDSPTIRKVVEATLRRAGFRVTTAEDGQAGLEAAQRANPDLIFLDFVMPRMNGFQFCQALRGIANIARVPVVLMSAKGDKIGHKFIQQMGAVDSITKPFSPDALLAVTEHVLTKYGGTELFLAEPESVRLDDEDLEEVEDLEPDQDTTPGRPSLDRIPTAEIAQAREVADQIAAHVVDVLTSALPDLAQRGDELEEALARNLSPKALATLSREISKLEPAAGLASFAGELSAVPLAEVFQLLQLQGQTGCFEVRRDRFRVRIFLRAGLIDFALARDGRGEFLLGRYLVEEEFIGRAEFDQLVKNRGPDAGLIGEQLVKLGYVTQEDLVRALERQTCELVYEVLRWKRGRYAYRAGVSAREAEAARLGLPVGTILMEGFRRVDEWRVIEQQIEDFDVLLMRDEAAVERFGRDRLTRDEQLVLDAVDGRRAVRSVIEATGMGSFLVCKLLYRLLSVNLIQRRD